ncbi:hypothetical protein NIES4102_09900 [Chondrocystis sp. NIES-4102]|nr:hypothetical protein NIES4102_09900 [Chondrocystis sp. NIES-4102]
MAELEAAELEIELDQSVPRGTLRLVSIALATKYIASQLPSQAIQYPELKLDVYLSDRLNRSN